METFWKSELADEVGVSLLPVIRIFDDESLYNDAKSWNNIVYGAKTLDEHSLKQINDKYKKDFQYDTIIY